MKSIWLSTHGGKVRSKFNIPKKGSDSIMAKALNIREILKLNHRMNPIHILILVF